MAIFGLADLDSIATKQDVENHFASHGGKILEIKLMNGFGFIEFEDELDARDIVPSRIHRPANMCDFTNVP